MANFFTWVVSNFPYIVGTSALIANAVCGVVVCVKKCKKTFKDTGDIVEAGKIFMLELKEVARNAIYEKEEMFKSASHNGIPTKTGAFKLDSVLKTIENECLRKGVAYDSNFWIEYVNAEVSKMKGVK